MVERGSMPLLSHSSPEAFSYPLDHYWEFRFVVDFVCVIGGAKLVNL